MRGNAVNGEIKKPGGLSLRAWEIRGTNNLPAHQGQVVESVSVIVMFGVVLDDWLDKRT